MNKILSFDSKEEEYFHNYCLELKQGGYLVSVTNSFPAFLLFDDYSLEYTQKLKTKDKQTSVKLINKCSYKPDFKIIFTEKALGLFTIDIGNPILDKDQRIVTNNAQTNQQLILSQKQDNNTYIAYIEIKPIFANTKNTSNEKYKILRKWVFDKYNVFVNTIKPLSPKGLFANTFTPAKYYNRFHKKTKQRLNIKWEPKSIKEYVSEKNKMERVRGSN